MHTHTPTNLLEFIDPFTLVKFKAVCHFDWLRGLPSVHVDGSQCVTVCCWTGLRGSLSRLQLDYVDIVFANRNDVNSPMEGES